MLGLNSIILSSSVVLVACSNKNNDLNSTDKKDIDTDQEKRNNEIKSSKFKEDFKNILSRDSKSVSVSDYEEVKKAILE
ncbi:conserved domain protein, partial [Mycoplasmopsis alligatoris A21JP2]